MSLETLKRDYMQLTSDLQGVCKLVKTIPSFFTNRLTLAEADDEIKRVRKSASWRKVKCWRGFEPLYRVSHAAIVL
jgi:hypothetical protein